MRNKEKIMIFVVVGRLAKSLTVSKITPITHLNKVKEVVIFREKRGFSIHNSGYITLPNNISCLKPHFVYFIVRTCYEILQLFFFAIKHKPDIINGIYTLPAGLYSFLVSKLVGAKSIISVIGGIVEVETYYKLGYFAKRLNLWMLRKCSIVTTTGSNVTKYLIEHKVEERKIFELPGSINTSIFFDPACERNIDILFVGKFRELKGPDRVLRIIKDLKNTFPNIKGCFLGSGYMLSLIQEEIKNNNLESNIKLMGHVENTDYYYQRAKLLIMPSRSEGLSMAMLEAMACGCVPIVSNVGNMTDAAHHCLNAMVVKDYLDMKTFVKYTKELLANKMKWRSFSNNAKHFVFNNYSIEAQSKIFNDILNRLTEEQ